MRSADEYRGYAAECLVLAQKVIDPEMRARLFEMAQAWRELADKVDSPKAQITDKAP